MFQLNMHALSDENFRSRSIITSARRIFGALFCSARDGKNVLQCLWSRTGLHLEAEEGIQSTVPCLYYCKTTSTWKREGKIVDYMCRRLTREEDGGMTKIMHVGYQSDVTPALFPV